MGKKPTRKPATQEGQSKEGGTKRQSTVRRHAKVTVSQEEDGTQIETQVTKKSAGTKRVKRKEGGGNTMNETNAYNQSLRQFALATCETGVQALADEFLKIKLMGQANIPPKTAFDANPDKNRYKDVICIDQSRVILTWPPVEGISDYIHANWAPVRGEKKFICTQGPIEKTVDDFWRLVWQEKTKAIIMLCAVIELGKKKCEQYWCEKGGEQMKVASGITIKTIDVAETEKNLVVTKLELSVEGQETFVCHHFLWKEWPDRGVPENFMACLRLLQRLKSYTPPTLVHCSAGIGRTGTIVGLEIANQILYAGDRLVLADVVKELRQYRHGSVQTDVQYIYMHRVLIGLAENKKIVKLEEIAPFYESYENYIKGKS